MLRRSYSDDCEIAPYEVMVQENGESVLATFICDNCLEPSITALVGANDNVVCNECQVKAILAILGKLPLSELHRVT